MIIRRTIYTPGDVRIREMGDGSESRTISGYAIVFNQPSEPFWDDDTEQVREVIAPEAVTESLLNRSDILMTLFHDNTEILGRANNGEGTLNYSVDAHGVSFEVEVPHTVDGERALELVKRGDIQGCSFAFTADYLDPKCVERTSETRDGKVFTTYTVRQITGVYDFTITPRPAYSQTNVEARDLINLIKREREEEKEDAIRKREHDEKVKAQVAEMRAQMKKHY